MIALIEDNREAIATLCREHGVRRLAIFGSAANDTFDPASSDIDILVDLGEYDDRVGRRFMRLVAGLENLIGRRIDVVTERGVTDSDFRRELDMTAKGIYGTTTSQATA